MRDDQIKFLFCCEKGSKQKVVMLIRSLGRHTSRMTTILVAQGTAFLSGSKPETPDFTVETNKKKRLNFKTQSEIERERLLLEQQYSQTYDLTPEEQEEIQRFDELLEEQGKKRVNASGPPKVSLCCWKATPLLLFS